MRFNSFRAVPLLCLAVVAGCQDPIEPRTQMPTQSMSFVTEPTLYALGNHTCALTTASVAYCWGKNSDGQLGLRTNTANEPQPENVREPAGVSFVALGGGTNHTCGLTSGGIGYCWGDNAAGQLGTGGNLPRNGPRAMRMPNGVTFSRISSGGGNFTCALTTTNAAYCWGDNTFGQLGDGTTTPRDLPRAVRPAAGVFLTSISTGFSHSCALSSGGVAYCWGQGGARLGNGRTDSYPRPRAVRMPNGVTFAQIAAGRDHSCALSNTGIAYCWGINTLGQLGNNKTDGVESLIPRVVRMPVGGVTFTQISAGDHHTCALGNNGTVYCWGWNISGQIGNGSSGGGTEAYRPVPVVMPVGTTFAGVTAKYLHSCAISTLGAAYCWGVNTNRELGTNGFGNRSSPTDVVNGSF